MIALVVTSVHQSDDPRIRERTVRSLAREFEVRYAAKPPAPATFGDHEWIPLGGSRVVRWFRALAQMLRNDVAVISVHDHELIPAALLARLENTPPLDCRVQAAVSILQKQSQSVEAVAATADVSRQHLRRLFRQHVGVGPKCFARVVRMRRLLALAKTVRPANWSIAALDAGYYDQAHMIAECRSLTGLTPTELVQR